MSNTSPTHQESNDYDIDDIVGVINTNNNEDTPKEMIGDYAGLASELDYNSFLQQQWLDLCSGLTRWNTEEVDGSGCPPLPTTQPQLIAMPTRRIIMEMNIPRTTTSARYLPFNHQ